jgi:hypothetical protein
MKSGGEEKFAAYLSQRGLAHEYEAPVGGKNPDFLVHASVGDVSCDVYEPEIKLPASRIGMFDPFPGLRKAFENNKYEQAKAARAAGMPFVLVLVRTNSDIAFDPIIVAGAMFGNISVELTIALEPGLPPPERDSRFVFGTGARLQPELNRAVSAIALPRTFNPTLRPVMEAYRERKLAIGDGDPATWSFDERTRAWDLMTETFDEFTAKSIYNDAASVSRVIVLHNPYCDIALDRTVFTGPWDEQWGLAEDDAYTLIVPAARASEIPD